MLATSLHANNMMLKYNCPSKLSGTSMYRRLTTLKLSLSMFAALTIISSAQSFLLLKTSVDSAEAFPFKSQNIPSEQLRVAGTPERLELEFKNAFKVPKGFEIRPLLREINKKLSIQIQSAKMKFSAGIGQSYILQDSLRPFVYEDIYLDTKNLDVLRHASSYRLRYRWKELSHYSRHQWFPFLRSFYPIRCEIQFKRRYRKNIHDGSMEALESRFEFRNSVAPFSLHQNAPGAPWPKSEYIAFAQTGRYENYILLPSRLLENEIGININSQSRQAPILVPTLAVTTIRYRTHINIEHNPWKWGKNPNQIFIISLDVSTWSYPDKSRSNEQILEVEIELDRNISTMLHVIEDALTPFPQLQNEIQARQSPSQTEKFGLVQPLAEQQRHLGNLKSQRGWIEHLAYNSSLRSIKLLDSDQRSIRDLVVSAVSTYLGKNRKSSAKTPPKSALDLEYKYARMLGKKKSELTIKRKVKK